jgi:hypothetical protein
MDINSDDKLVLMVYSHINDEVAALGNNNK